MGLGSDGDSQAGPSLPEGSSPVDPLSCCVHRDESSKRESSRGADSKPSMIEQTFNLGVGKLGNVGVANGRDVKPQSTEGRSWPCKCDVKEASAAC